MMKASQKKATGVMGLALVVAVALATPGAVLAQTSELYITTEVMDDHVTYVVQNGQVLREFYCDTSPSDGPALVVHDSIKTLPRTAGQTAHEYDFYGNPLSGQYVNDFAYETKDGATDGVHNYTSGYGDLLSPRYGLYESDADWGGTHLLFNFADIDPDYDFRMVSGLTYDMDAGTIWGVCLNYTFGYPYKIAQYDLSGSIISQFPITTDEVRGGNGLAWDPADGTLWVTNYWAYGSCLTQYDTQGNFLQRVYLDGAITRLMGAEFRVPEPTSALLLGLASLLLIRRR